MNRLFLCVWLVGILIFWPASGRTAPNGQEGTVPSPTPESVALVPEELYTIPEDLVNGDVFDLVVVLRNTSSFWIKDLAVTIQDVGDDQALIPVNGQKTELLSLPGPDQAIGLTKRLRYRTGISGLRQINLRIEFTYMLNEQTIFRTQTETLTVRVLEPTPTPTSTLTPTPTVTLTVTSTKTAPSTPNLAVAEIISQVTDLQEEIATIRADTATPDLSAIVAANARATTKALAATVTAVVIAATAQPDRASSLAPTASPTSTSRANAAESRESTSGEVDLSEIGNAVVVEFEAVPSSLTPGQIFTMILIVRNNSPVTLSEIIVEWDRAGSDPMIAPSGGGTRWFLGALPAGASNTLIRRFYVTKQATPGVKIGRVLVTYSQDNREWGDASDVNLLVERYVPPWLRFLRALFGGLIP